MNEGDVKEVDIPDAVKQRWFKDVDQDKISRLRMSRYSLYATSLADHTLFLLDVLRVYFGDLSKLTITDATSCIGGNARMFVGKFKHVNIVDVSKLHIDILRNNFAVLDISGSHTIYNENYLNVGAQLKQDIIFIDVPWGGINYRDMGDDDMFLLDDEGKKVCLRRMIMARLYLCAKMIVVKVPASYNVAQLKGIGFASVKVINVMKSVDKINYKMILLSHVFPMAMVPNKKMLSTVNYKVVFDMMGWKR